MINRIKPTSIAAPMPIQTHFEGTFFGLRWELP